MATDFNKAMEEAQQNQVGSIVDTLLLEEEEEEEQEDENEEELK